MKTFAQFLICASLLASPAIAGPTTAERKSQFEKAMNLIIATISPRMSERVREGVVHDYVESEPNKGQAIEPVSGGAWRSSRHEDLDAASDRTLEGCQLRYGKPCGLLALNGDIAAEGELKTRDMPRVHYDGEFDLAKIPIIRPAVRARADVQGYFGVTAPKAIAIHPWGTLFVSTGKPSPRDAQDAALAACNADPGRNFKDGNCFVYAVGNQVVISERRQLGK
ncbi:DUF4189 domain-containing protein [Bradyrhizobium sp. BR 10289]|uniref:DUF4189 domain-containing protein n=1 Tax=Bradyrhizobium sp. BR 10289 TaxID=2749993 RepID=UPI001C64F786|nr:DUF4189 domain-containing protein [Bradyrhizobium sp. BR 10289]MBW7969809.1 hypothetical protein [Bradyrhizobium sp. BR 10289]